LLLINSVVMLEQQIEGFRLSPQQKHLWLLQQKDNVASVENSDPYRVSVAILIAGKVDLNALKTAFQKVIDRYEILRTSFHCLPGMTVPLQVIDDLYQISISECSFSGNVDSFIARLDNSPLRIETGIPLATNLVNLSSEKHLLVISLSALIADGRSTDLLLSEIASCYSQIVDGKEIEEAGMQYADIAEWQNEILENSDSKSGRDYWKNCQSKVNLWLENSPSDRLSFQPQVTKFHLEDAASIRLAARQCGIDCADFLLAAWQVLLWKISSRSPITISVAIDPRKYAELERSLGLLTKYLPLQSEVTQEQSFATVASQAHRLKAEAEEWQEYFSGLPNTEKNLLPADYPIGFEYQTVSPKIETDGVSFAIYQQYACLDRLKLKLTCLENDAGLDIELHYDPQVFKPEDINSLRERWQILLKGAIANPEIAIGKLEVTSELERKKLLIEFNQTETNYQQDKCIDRLFAEIVERSPDAVAVVCDSEQLTYSQLNAKSDRVASYLQECGISSETPIALCVERSLDAIVGMLGILKAGAAYLPLDSAMPAARLNSILEDAQPQLLLTQPHLNERFSLDICPVISISEAVSTSNPKNITLSPHFIAYIIYTSGSTGNPKGIAVEHRQLLNYLYGILECLNLPVGSSFATVSTLAADLGNTAIFPALATGGCLHVISSDRVMDAEALAAYFENSPVDCLKIVPSHLDALLNSPRAKSILPRQRLVLGGEALSWDLIDRLGQLGAKCQIINHYGPTETTVGVLTYPIGKRDIRSATVPIGKAIANTQIYLLDEYLQPVPIGVAGEIYIGGASVARGYWRNPELTAEKFIKNPFSTYKSVGAQSLAPKTRDLIYKTGDLARYLPDGNLEFLGRIDNQVKIRGFRIELGEIEAALQQHPDITRAVVMAREDTGLVAYLIASQDRDWRGFLSSQLPDYAIPSAFIKLAVLPLTPNGKVDWQRLPAPERIKSNFVPPRTDIEQNIADIWSQVLRIEQIGIEDSFFDLGGHSLSATQVISRLRQFFQLDLPLRYLFDFPTIGQLSEVITQKLAEQVDSEAIAQMLAELEQLSPTEVEEVLAQQGGKRHERP
jgi:amino acid adenylation domain-containing protein